MGYNREDYIKIKAEYSNKYLRARAKADEHRRELHEKLPTVREIDFYLAGTGKEIMDIIISGKNVETRVEALKEKNRALLSRRAECLKEAGYPEDYSDIQYECSICADSGYVDGKMCECMRRELVLAGYESSGLGGLIGKQTFDNFSLEYYKNPQSRENMSLFSSGLRRFAESFDGTHFCNYLLIGGTGLGKTHLSTAVAKTVIDRGFDVLYVTAVGMIRDFEDKRFGSGEGAINSTDRYYSADLLIIDDLGTEIVNQFTLSCLYDVINARINNKKCTFINTNLTQKEIEAKYNERITSRLFGEYKLLTFSGTDIRLQKKMNK